MIMSLKQKKRKIKPRIKLNHNIYTTWFDNARPKYMHTEGITSCYFYRANSSGKSGTEI